MKLIKSAIDVQNAISLFEKDEGVKPPLDEKVLEMVRELNLEEHVILTAEEYLILCPYLL